MAFIPVPDSDGFFYDTSTGNLVGRERDGVRKVIMSKAEIEKEVLEAGSLESLQTSGNGSDAIKAFVYEQNVQNDLSPTESVLFAEGASGGGTADNLQSGDFGDPNFSGATNFSDEQLNDILSGSGLQDDEQELLKKIFAISTEQNQEEAQRMIDALKLGAEFSDPLFRFKARLVEDGLVRAVNNLEDDLEFKEEQLRNALGDLREDVKFSKGQLDLELESQLKQMEKQLTQDLEKIRQDMAATGFTQSSRRLRNEQLKEEAAGDLRESTERRFGIQQRDLDTSLARAERDTASEIERLTQVATGQKTELAREAESQLGSDFTLPGLEDIDKIGDFEGSIELDRKSSIASFI